MRRGPKQKNNTQGGVEQGSCRDVEWWKERSGVKVVKDEAKDFSSFAADRGDVEGPGERRHNNTKIAKHAQGGH